VDTESRADVDHHLHALAAPQGLEAVFHDRVPRDVLHPPVVG
jgi:hypothetical protein